MCFCGHNISCSFEITFAYFVIHAHRIKKHACDFILIHLQAISVIQMRQIHQCYKLWQLAMPETYENWLGRANTCVYCACKISEIYLALPYSVGFKDPPSKKVLSKRSFVWNRGPVNSWYDCKAQTQRVRRTCNYLLTPPHHIVYSAG